MTNFLRSLTLLAAGSLLSLHPATGLAQSLTKAGQMPSTGGATSIDGQNNTLYLANFSVNTLESVDVTAPAAPASRGSVAVNGRVRGVAVGGSTAYVTNFGTGSATTGSIVAYGLQNPVAPVAGNAVTTGAPTFTDASSAVVCAVTTLYGSGAPRTVLQVYNPALQLQATVEPINSGAGAPVIYGTTAYVSGSFGAGNGPGSQVFDLSNPQAPVVLPATPAVINAVGGSLGFGVKNESLEVYDLSTPQTPALLGNAALASGTGSTSITRKVAVSGTIVYVLSYSASGPLASGLLQAFDVSQPAAPALKASLNLAANTVTGGFFARGDYAYVVLQDANNSGILAAYQYQGAAISISSFSPASGSAGTPVTLTGAGFTGATAVAFNGTAASSFTVNSATSITAVVAAGSTTGPITVTGPGGTASSGSSFTVAVTPPAVQDDSFTTTEDSPVTGNVLTNDAGVSLQAALSTGPAHGAASVSADGSFTYTPAANYNGSDSFTYQACSGSSGLCSTGTVTITISAVNDAPTVTAPARLAVPQNAAAALTGIACADVDSGAGLVRVSFTVPAGTLAAVTGSGVSAFSTGPILVLQGTLTDLNNFLAAGKVSYTSEAGATGTVEVSITVNDNGNTGTGGAKTATTTMQLTITPVIALTPGALPAATVGVPYSLTVTASGGTAPYTYTAAGPLPAGLTFSATGTLAGTPGAGAAGSYPITITAQDNAGSPGPYAGSNSYTLVVNAAPASATVWSGTNTNWFDAGNWTAGVPAATDDVLIAFVGSGQYPVLGPGAATARTLTIGSGAVLTQTGGTLTLTGDLVVNGSFTASGGQLALSGPSPQTLGGAGPTHLWDLTVGSAGAGLSGGSDLRHVLQLNGPLSTNGQTFTLLSSAATTAMVVNASASAVVDGAVVVQRYVDPTLNPGLGYRHFSSPVQATTVADLATTSFTPVVNPAYNAGGSAVNPFPTVYGYDEARLTGTSAVTQDFGYGYFSPTTLSATLTPGRSYTVNLGANQTVDLRGPLNAGTVAVGALTRGTQANSGWHLLGNPYPAPLDWKKARLSLPAGVLDAIYVYKSSNQYDGSYQFYQNGFGTLPDGLVGSMQGFFVRVSQPVPAFSFQEAWRATTYPASSPVFNRPTADPRPAVQLDLVTAQGGHEPTFIYFEPGATAGVDDHYDAEKLPNTTGLNLASVAAGTGLAVNGLPLSNTLTTVPLTVGVPTTGTYTLTAAALLNLANTDVSLHDAVTGQQVNLKQQASYSFAASSTALITNRFTLHFGPLAPLSAKSSFTAASVDLYPNPAREQVTVRIPAGAVAGAAQAQLVLYNGLGQPVQEKTLPLPAAGAQTVLDVQTLPPGLYGLRITVGTSTITKSVVLR